MNRLKRITTFKNISKSIDSGRSFDIEANLRSWGLIGHTVIQRQDSKLLSFVRRKIFWHRFRLFILWLLTIKLFYCCSLTNDSPLTYYLGDVSGFMGVPKLQMSLIMALWTLPGPIIIFEFIKFKNTNRMKSWVQIYDMFRERGSNIKGLTFVDRAIAQQIKQKFRRRIRQTKLLYRFFVFGAVIGGGGSIIWTLLFRWPEHYRQSIWAYIWSFIDIFWIYFNQKSVKSCLIIFNQICYYITLRFRKLDTNLKHLRMNWHKYSESNIQRLQGLLKEHEYISNLTQKCNEFWSLFIITNTVIKVPLLLLSIDVCISADMALSGRLVSLFMTASIGLYTTLIYFSASQVEYSSRKSYQLLNSLSLKPMPLSLKHKLLNTIQRMSTRNIGFDISAIHTITYMRFFEMVTTGSIGFLLVIGFKFKSFDEFKQEIRI